MLDAAALAAILDPQRKDTRLWGSCLYCCKDTGHHYWCTGKDKLARYIGPPDLHTAREHCWRMEEWLEKKSYGTVRALGITQVFKACGCPENDVLVEENTDHTAALVAAIERISNG